MKPNKYRLKNVVSTSITKHHQKLLRNLNGGIQIYLTTPLSIHSTQYLLQKDENVQYKPSC
jgi:uncharacterized membrane protein